MSPRAASWLAWSLWTLSVPLAACSGVLGFLSASARSQPTWGLFSTLFVFLALTFPTVGALVASRRSENPIGWIFCAGGLVLSLVVCANNFIEYALHTRSSGPLPGVGYAAWIATWLPIPTLLLIATMLFLLFPDGRVTSPEWVFVAWTAVIGGVTAALGQALGRRTAGTDYGSIDNPLAVGGFVGNTLYRLSGFGFVLLMLSCLASIAVPFVRLSQARGQERQQLKWFAYAATVSVGGVVITLLGAGSSDLLWNLGWGAGILGFAFLPVATAIAILKYRLYDIDRIINRTLVYGSLTVVLAGVYLGGVAATQAIFQRFTGQEELPQLAIVASTLAIAALFNPLRRRIQFFIDRRFYRHKYDAARTLDAFNSRLRDETDLDALNDDLVGVIRETMQPAHVGLWLRPASTASNDSDQN